MVPFTDEPKEARHRLKAMPVFGGLFSRMFKWTRTIHPDPDYVITRILDP